MSDSLTHYRQKPEANCAASVLSEWGTHRSLHFTSPSQGSRSNPSSYKTGESPLSRSSHARNTVKAFLKINAALGDSGERRPSHCIRTIGSSVVAMKPPNDTQFIGCKEGRFMYSKVFDAKAGADDMYEQCILPMMDEFLQGQHTLILSHGSENLDMLRGSKESDGLVQRITSCVMNSIKHLRSEDEYNGETRELDESTNQVFVTPSKDDSQYANQPEYAHFLNGSVLNKGLTFAVSMSCIHIKDEKVHYLTENQNLEENESQNENAQPSDYEVFVDSLEDALEIIRKCRLLIEGANRENQPQNHNSHFIVNITLHQPIMAAEAGDFKDAVFSRLSFVDVGCLPIIQKHADSNRPIDAQAVLDPSFVALEKCVNVIRTNSQSAASSKPADAPHDESVLTTILRHYFIEPSHIAMVANVCSSAQSYQLSFEIMKHTALAKEIQSSLNEKSLAEITQSFSRRKLLLENTHLLQGNTELHKEIERLENLLFESEIRCQEIEADIRFEVSNEMAQRLREMDVLYRSRLEQENLFIQEMYDNKLRLMQKAASRKKHSVSQDDSVEILYEELKNSHEKLLAMHEEAVSEIKQKSDLLVMKQIEIERLNKVISENETKRAVLVTKLSLEQQTIEKLEKEKGDLLKQTGSNSNSESSAQIAANTQQEMLVIKRIHAIELKRLLTKLEEKECTEKQLRTEIDEFQRQMHSKDKVIEQLQKDLEENQIRESSYKRIIAGSGNKQMVLLDVEREEKETLRLEMEELRRSLQEATNILRKIPLSQQLFQTIVAKEAHSPTLKRMVGELSPCNIRNPNEDSVLHYPLEEASPSAAVHEELKSSAMTTLSPKPPPSFKKKQGFQNLSVNLPGKSAPKPQLIVAESETLPSKLTDAGKTNNVGNETQAKGAPGAVLQLYGMYSYETVGFAQPYTPHERVCPDTPDVSFIQKVDSVDEISVHEIAESELSPRKRKSPRTKIQPPMNQVILTGSDPETPKRMKSHAFNSPSAHAQFESLIPDIPVNTSPLSIKPDEAAQMQSFSHPPTTAFQEPNASNPNPQTPQLVVASESHFSTGTSAVKQKSSHSLLEKSKKIAKALTHRRQHQSSQSRPPPTPTESEAASERVPDTNTPTESSKKGFFSRKKKHDGKTADDSAAS